MSRKLLARSLIIFISAFIFTSSNLAYALDPRDMDGITTVSSNEPKTPAMNMKFEATVSPPEISISPSFLNFGMVKTGATAIAKKITVKNTGISDLNISPVSLDGDASFSQTNTCVTLIHGQSCAIFVTFTPHSSGSKSAHLTIISNDPAKGTVVAKLGGIGYLPFSKPEISSLSSTPSSAKAGGININLTLNFDFKDTGGDLNGGSLNIDWGGNPIIIDLGGDFAHKRKGSAHVTITFISFYPIVGDITVSGWLIDKGGRRSESSSFIFTQTQPTWPDQWKSGIHAEGTSIAVDSNNRIYVAGFYNYPVTQYSGGVVAQYQTNAINMGLLFIGGQLVRAVTIDSSNNLCIAGQQYNTDKGSPEVFVAKCDLQEQLLWKRVLSSSKDDIPLGISIDKNDNIYVTGGTAGDLDGNTNAGNGWGYDIFLSKFDPSGSKQWTRLLGTPDNQLGCGIAADSNNNICLTGYTEGSLDGNENSPTSHAAFLIKYDASGVKQWTKLIGANSNSNGNGITIDSDDNIYITGDALGDMDGVTHPRPGSTALFLSKHDSSGNTQWIRLLGTSTSTTGGNAIAVGHNNDIYITGTVYGNLDGYNVTNTNVLLVKYDASGTQLWTQALVTQDVGIGQGVSIDSDNNVYITGSVQDDLNGNISLGYTDIFIGKYDSNGIEQH